MVFKCKMCGGDIESLENNIGKCMYCSTIMTLPNSNDEKIVNLYNRANNLRLNNEFDKSAETYEKILEIDNNQIEANWGLVLCKYGVEYVDDPVTKEKIPTCHRTIDESILTDLNFVEIKKKSNKEALELYKKEAEQINDIQKRILDISSKEEPYDIFICYKETDKNNERTNDSVLAEEIYEKLTELKYKVFFARITLEDKLGTEYEPYIFSALKSSKIMLVVGTNIENYQAIWVKNEWSRYLKMMKKDKSKTLIPVYSKMDAYELPEEFAMLQAQNMDKVGGLQDLTRGIQKIINSNKNNNAPKDSAEIYEKLKNELGGKVAGKYEVPLIKETLSAKYKSACIAIFFIVAMIIPLIGNYLYSVIPMFDYHNELYYMPIFTFGVFTVIIWLVSIVNRKGNKLSKILYIISIVEQMILGIVWKTKGNVIPAYWYTIFLTNIGLLLYNPKWKIDAKTRVYLDEEAKQKQEKKNEKIIENFTERDKSVINKPVAIAVLVGALLVTIFTFVYKPNQGNERNASEMQLQVTADYINIRGGMHASLELRGKVYKDDIYTIQSTEKNGEGTWYEIETKNGITGYICGKEGYIKLLE